MVIDIQSYFKTIAQIPVLRGLPFHSYSPQIKNVF